MEENKKVNEEIVEEVSEVTDEKVVNIDEKKKVVKPKNLTLTEMKKLNRKIDQKEEVTIFIEVDNEDGETESLPYTFTYDRRFRKSKQYKVMDDVLKLYESMDEHPELVDMATPYISLMVIKQFTSIQVPDNVTKALEILDILIDLQIFDKILNSLPEDEIIKFYEDIDKSIKKMGERLDDIDAETEKLQNTVEDDLVKKMITDV